LSKEECRQHVVKEAFKIDIVEVNERTIDKEKLVKIVQEIAKFNCQSAHQELLIQRLEAELRDLKELYNEHKRKFPNKFDLPHSPVEGNCGVEAKGGEECSIEGAVDGAVDGAVEGSVGGCVEGVVEDGVKGAEERHVEGVKEGVVEVVVVDVVQEVGEKVTVPSAEQVSAEVGVDSAEAVDEEGGAQSVQLIGEDFQGQGEHNNMYNRMKADPRPRQQSWLKKSPWIVCFRKRRRKLSEPHM